MVTPRVLSGLVAVAIAVPCGSSARGQTPTPTPTATVGAGIAGVVAPGTPVELVRGGFEFLEGPNGTADGGLYFSDLRANRIYRLRPDGTVDVVRERSNGTNGLALDHNGDLLGAEHDTRRISRLKPDGTVVDFATHDATGAQLLRPNDLVVGRRGVYFSDPGPFPNNRGKAYVHVVAPDGTVTMIADSLKTPNGLALTLDERTLLVDDTEQNEIFAFDLTADGRPAGAGRVFARLRDIQEGQRSYADGMAMDAAGRLYVTSTPGVQVFDAKGGYLGTLPVPTQPSSVAFSGPEGRTLYITARQNLYRVTMLSRGPTRPGKK